MSPLTTPKSRGDQMPFSIRFIRALAVLTVGAAIPMDVALAQDSTLRSGPSTLVQPNWGTTSSITKSWGAIGFRVVQGTFMVVNGFDVNCPASTCIGEALLDLPTGALITGFGVEACDTSSTGGIHWTVYKYGVPEGSSTTIVPLQSIAPGSQCAVFTYTLPTPITVDNQANNYFARVSYDTDLSSILYYRSFRAFYKLQVSPDPSTATFADVPVGHPFHRFVEALHAAGITGGCGGTPPNFCPDAPVTRGQMAVFLAGALGLHWAP
jgi:hypothetical protein